MASIRRPLASTGVAGQTVIAYADSVNPALDMSFRMFCTDGVTRLSFSAPGAGQNNLLVFTLPVTGTSYLRAVCAVFALALLLAIQRRPMPLVQHDSVRRLRAP